MKNLKNFLLTAILVLIGLISAHQVLAETTYTKEDVAQHNTTASCWAIYETGVYDITTYLNIHNQKYSNITSWCGTDMTTSFDSIGKHQGEATTLLASFRIGTLTATAPVITAQVETASPIVNTVADTSKIIKINNPYNLFIPLVLGILLYWGSLLLFSKKIKQFNAFWNTILFLTFFIPSFGFGIFMMLQYKFPSLMDIDFRFMYWHVEFSVLMGVLAISHFVRRIKIYFMQLKPR